jgi:hypothetical protein
MHMGGKWFHDIEISAQGGRSIEKRGGRPPNPWPRQGCGLDLSRVGNVSKGNLSTQRKEGQFVADKREWRKAWHHRLAHLGTA